MPNEQDRPADPLSILQKLAQDNGFELLDTQWLGSVVKHRFRHIESGKEREWRPTDLFARGFPKDLRTDQDRYEELKQLATDNGFELLETPWFGAKAKHRFRHIESGKEYDGRPADLTRQGFPKDLRSDQDKFDQLKQLATDNGYELLETQWLGTKVKHRFRHIELGKEREWLPNQLFSDGFPNDLRTDQDRFEELKQLAQSNGFDLLDTQWMGSVVKHRFRHIESGKEREWTPAQLFSLGFPKELRTDHDKFKQLRQLAQDNGFELLETEWLGALTKHRFKHIDSGRLYEGPPANLQLRGFPAKPRKQDPLPSENSSSADSGEMLDQGSASDPARLVNPTNAGSPSMEAPPDEDDDEAGTAAPTPAP